MNFDMPYKTYLGEEQIPRRWYNIAFDLSRSDTYGAPPPLLNPSTGKPVTLEELSKLFCVELAKQELNREDAWIAIPDEVVDFYRMYRPSPLVRAFFLEKELDTPARIFYKFEGGNTSGSHKLNTAIAQTYYAKEQGLRGVVTETGAGQWGTALSMACAYFHLDCQVFMVRTSMEQKPYRPLVMRTFGAQVNPSPSTLTAAGRALLAKDPDCLGSLGTAITEAVETALSKEGYRYVLGSALDQVVLHQTMIGLESEAAFAKLSIKPDIVIASAGGGSNLGGLAVPFIRHKLEPSVRAPKIIAVETASCPTLTKGEYRYDFCDEGEATVLAKMYTLGHKMIPPASHAGGLRYHGMSPLVSKLYDDGLIDEARALDQEKVFKAGQLFAKTEGILPAPESSHAICAAIDEALACRESGEEKNILFGLTGTGHFDLAAYANVLRL